jgi:hypothetical protein
MRGEGLNTISMTAKEKKKNWPIFEHVVQERMDNVPVVLST